MSETRLFSPKVIIVALLALAIGGLLLAAPTLISRFGTPLMVDRADRALPGSIVVDELRLSWFGTQGILGLQVLSAEREPILQVASIEADAGLLSFLTAPHCKGTITLEGLQGELIFDAAGKSNLERALVAGEEPADAAPPLLPNCRLLVHQGDLSLASPGLETIFVSGIEADFDLRDMAEVHTRLVAQVTPAEAAPGKVTIEASARELLGPDGSLQPRQAKVKVDSRAERLPVDLLDRIAGLQGKLTALLGGSMNQELQAEYAAGQGFVRMTADTSGSAALELDWAIQDNGIVARAPANFTLQLTPEAWRQLSESEAVLTGPVRVEGTISDLQLTPGEESLHARLAVSDIELRHPDADIGAMALRDTELTIGSERLSEGIAFRMDTVAEQARYRGAAHLDGRLNGLLDEHLVLTPDKMRADLNGRIENLPLAIFDELLQQDGLLVAALGAQLNATFEAVYDPATQQGELSLNAASERLKARLDGRLGADAIELAQSGRLELDLQPVVFARLTQAASLTRPARIDVTLEQLTVPRDQAGLQLSDAAIRARATSERMDLVRASDGRPLNLRALALKLETARLADGLEGGFDAEVNGGSLQVALHLPQSTWQDGRLQLSSQSKLTLNADPQAAAALLPEDLRPASALRADISVAQFDLPLDDPARGAVAINLAMSPLTFAGGTLGGMEWRDTSASLEGAPLGAGVDLQLRAQLAHAGGVGSLGLQAQFSGVPEAPALGSARLTIDDLPGTALDSLAGQQGQLAELLGGTVDAQLTVRAPEKEALAFEFSAESPRLKASGKGRRDPQGLQLQPGSTLAMTLSPDFLKALMADGSWSLAEPAAVQLRLDGLSVLSDAADGLSTVGLEAKGQLSAARVALLDGTGAPLLLRDLSIGFKTPRLDKRLDLEVAVVVPGPAGTSTDGRLQSTTSVMNLVDRTGGISFADARIITDTRMESISSASMMQLLGQDPALGPALGPVVTATVKGSRPGDVKVELAGDNTRATIDASIRADQVLRLRDDAVFELNITPELVDVFLSKLHPLLGDVQASQEPVRLSLLQSGFQVPLDRYAPKEIRLDGRLEIGTLVMQRGPATGALFSALRLLGSQVADRPTFPAEFTALEFNVADGLVRTNDLWMTMDRIMLGSQARLFLPANADDPATADVLFGVPGRTLQMIPSLGARISPDALYEIADSGPVGELAPDFGKLFAGIVPSAALDSLANKAGDEQFGDVLGTLSRVLQQASKKPDAGAGGQHQPIAGWQGATWPNMPKIEPEIEPQPN